MSAASVPCSKSTVVRSVIGLPSYTYVDMGSHVRRVPNDIDDACGRPVSQPRTSDLGPRTSDLGPRISDLGSRTSDLGPRTSDLGPRTSDLEHDSRPLVQERHHLLPECRNLRRLERGRRGR